MKYYLTTLDRNSDPPQWAKHMLFDYMPWSTSLSEADAVFVIVSTLDRFECDHVTLHLVQKSKLPVVVFDYYETSAANRYAELKQALKELPIVGYFLRDFEAHSSFSGCPVWPLEFTTERFPAYDLPESRPQYNQRPVDVLMLWGYSAVDRVKLHGALMRKFTDFRHGPAPAQTLEDVEHYLGNGERCPLALIYTPHYRRIPKERVMWLQNQAKITVSLFGNGLKCFRSVEAGYNSVGAHQAPETLSWAYPWIDRHNCVGLDNTANTRLLDVDKAVDSLIYWTVIDPGALYTLYTHSHANNQKYIRDVYVRDYIMPRISQVCSS